MAPSSPLDLVLLIEREHAAVARAGAVVVPLTRIPFFDSSHALVLGSLLRTFTGRTVYRRLLVSVDPEARGREIVLRLPPLPVVRLPAPEILRDLLGHAAKGPPEVTSPSPIPRFPDRARL